MAAVYARLVCLRVNESVGLSVHLDIYVFKSDNISPPCGERHLMWIAACFQGKSHSPWRPAEPHVGRDALRAAGLTGAAALDGSLVKFKKCLSCRSLPVSKEQEQNIRILWLRKPH